MVKVMYKEKVYKLVIWLGISLWKENAAIKLWGKCVTYHSWHIVIM